MYLTKCQNKKCRLESQNRVLFVGNGINDAQKINWNDMLIYVQDRLFEDKSIDSEKISNLDGTSPTLFFESLCKSSSNPEETEKKLRDFVKDYVNDKSNFVHKLWDLYNVIITIISRKSGQKIPKIANLQYYKSKANYGTKKKGISR